MVTYKEAIKEMLINTACTFLVMMTAITVLMIFILGMLVIGG